MRTLVPILFVATAVVWAQNSGSFAGEYANTEVRLQLERSGDQYAGTLQYQGTALPVRGSVRGAELVGTFSVEGREFPFQLKQDGSAVVLTTDGTSYRLEAVKKTPANPLARGATATVKEQGLVGAWRGPQGSMTFMADGSGLANGSPFRYEVSGAIVTMTGSDGVFRLTYSIDGSTLRLTGPTGQLVLSRVTEPSGGGSVSADLAGKWCYVSNVYATGGGARASNSCFTLYPDGRYEYAGETDSYNKFGGATSQSADRGTWTATPTSITAHSSSGKVTIFSLEKRNHPKNNDPMLVINGQAFVTFYQKPPWR
jgi:hypothetical protein